jgi:hypothetical protein
MQPQRSSGEPLPQHIHAGKAPEETQRDPALPRGFEQSASQRQQHAQQQRVLQQQSLLGGMKAP